MFAKLDKYGLAITLVHRLTCKVTENIKVNYKMGVINIGWDHKGD